MNEKDDKDISLLRRHCAELMEHFDAVQVFAIRQARIDGEMSTVSVADGSGCILSRKGKVRDWLIDQDHRVRLERERRDREDD